MLILLGRYACSCFSHAFCCNYMRVSVVKISCAYIQNEVKSLSASQMGKSDPESDGENVFHSVMMYFVSFFMGHLNISMLLP